jgi:ABC-2 type transport system ATP-binding protein
MNWIIETQGLGKHYGKIVAVNNLSLRVAEGEIYAFLGLNGAGKTTTIRMLLGMIRPTSGSATVLQTPVRMGRREPWSSVGYLVEIPKAYPELTVVENLEIARRFHPGTLPKAVDQIIERLGLSAYAGRRAGILSQGNAQRLGLAKALLHNPKLLVLDEPANGLDPSGIVEIRQLLLDLTREQGVTIFMSSHILAEVSRLARRIGIIHEGRLLQELDIADLEKNRKKRLVIRSRSIDGARSLLAERNLPSVILSQDTLELNDAQSIACPEEIAGLLVQAGIPLSGLVVEEEELEQYFLRLVGVNGETKNG